MQVNLGQLQSLFLRAVHMPVRTGGSALLRERSRAELLFPLSDLVCSHSPVIGRRAPKNPRTRVRSAPINFWQRRPCIFKLPSPLTTVALTVLRMASDTSRPPPRRLAAPSPGHPNRLYHPKKTCTSGSWFGRPGNLGDLATWEFCRTYLVSHGNALQEWLPP